ncbi:MAG: methylated-DNA--[protein]-cysteine S-methyltransferase [Proteobacteria bacterium]|nr:methylated-DNA--[protein]-cysteine S-methyltransferase [Pseudomonadota bacterium]
MPRERRLVHPRWRFWTKPRHPRDRCTSPPTSTARYSPCSELVRDGYATTMRDDAKTGTVRRAIEAWTQGEAGALDALPIAWHHGTAWQEQVWRGLRTIPFGETWTYGQLARALGRPTAVRAVARANATNRVPLIVPCHRVIGTDGTLTGFGGGLHLKARLLNHERRVMGLPEHWKA